MRAMVIERVNRGYLATNQLNKLRTACAVHVRATVETSLTKERREFSWLWDGHGKRPLLVNRLTGTLFDPVTGQGLGCEPRLLEAPITVPKIEPGADLPHGLFSTGEPA